MQQILVSNGGQAEVVLTVEGKGCSVAYQDHWSLLRALAGLADHSLLVSPYLYEDFVGLFSGLSLRGVGFELISSIDRQGSDQLKKPFSLRNFGQVVQQSTRSWPAIGLTDDLHSKIYVFSKQGAAFAGLVTSANLTDSGLRRRHHETGVLLVDPESLQSLMIMARTGLKYVSLAPHQLDKLCDLMAENRERFAAQIDEFDAGLAARLAEYATPSAGNREIRLAAHARYFIKVSGVRDRPILPDDGRRFDQPHVQLDFTQEPQNIRLGDCLLEVAVGGMCFLSYYACASRPFKRTDEEKQVDPDYVRRPVYVYANNLSLRYGAEWFAAPLMYDVVIEEFLAAHPGVHVTAAGGDHIRGAMQYGSSYVQVTPEFGQFVKDRLDSWVLPV
jgi:hypothetical protein